MQPPAPVEKGPFIPYHAGVTRIAIPLTDGGHPFMRINQRRLFIASCIALVTTAMTFSIRGDILSAFGREFDLSHQQQGWINLAGIWGFPLAILLVGPLVDMLGMGRLLALACAGHVAGVLLTIASPAFGFPALLLATLVIGCANGTVEGVINPLVATVYPDDKTGKLNRLHAWWPGGLIVGGLLCIAINPLLGVGGPEVPAATLSFSWKIKMATVLIAALVYGVMIMGQRFPQTERAAAGVSTGEMFAEALRPGYLLILLAMAMTAITELGPDQWVGSVLTDTVGLQGIMFLVYTSGLMFVLRYAGGALAHRLSPFGLLALSAGFAAAGLYALSRAFTPLAAFAAATVFAVGKTYFWPTMLGVTSERYPRGGSLLMAMTGAMGMFAAGLAGPVMGRIYDTHTIRNLPEKLAAVVVVDGRFSPEAQATLHAPADLAAMQDALRQGAAMTFRYVAVLPLILIVLFAGLFLWHRSRGGYRAVKIAATRASPRRRR